MRDLRFAALVLTVLAVAEVTPAAAGRGGCPGGEDPLAAAVETAAAQAPRGHYAYVRSLTLETGDEHVDRVEHFDPVRPAGERWSLEAVDGRTPSAEELADYDPPEESERAFELYAELLAGLDLEEAECVSRDDDRAVYRLARTRANFLDENQEDFADHLLTELIVDLSGPAPYVSEVAITAPEPFSPSIAARVRRFATVFRYARHTDTGDILPQDVHVDLSVSALLFISVEATTRIGFSDFRPVVPPREG